MNNLLAVNVGAITDVVALMLLLAFALIGLAKGFVKSFFSIFGTIIALLLAIILAPSVASFLERSTSIATAISGGLETFIKNIVGEEVINLTLLEASENALEKAGVGGWIISLILSFKGLEGLPLDVTVGQLICPTFAYYIVVVLSVVLLFIILKVIMFLVGQIVKDMYKIKLVEKTDKWLGFLIGLINGIVTINFVMLILSIIPISWLQDFYVSISTSNVLKFISTINVYGYLLNFISTKGLSRFILGLFAH